MTEFLKSILVEAYPETERPEEKQEPAPTCEWCGEEHEDLVEVDDSDPSVGYYSTVLMCANCRYKQGIKKRNPYS